MSVGFPGSATQASLENTVNLNLVHNVLNFLLAIIGGLAAFDFSSIVSQSTAGLIISVLAMMKLIMNALRDGIAGMAKPQPPVQQ